MEGEGEGGDMGDRERRIDKLSESEPFNGFKSSTPSIPPL